MWIYTLLPQILNMSLTASIVIILVLLVRWPLKKAPKMFSYALWAVVLFRLVCPVSFSSQFSLMGLLHTPTSSTSVSTYSSIDYLPADIVHTEFPQVDLPLPGVSQAINDSLPQGSEQLVADPLKAPMAIATELWIVGIVGMLIYSAVSLMRLRRKLIGAVRLRDNIYLADHISSPFVIGIIRPKIYLPSTLPKAEQSYVILHEQTHIKRLDPIFKLLAFLTLALHWFNPLVWVAFIYCVKDMEMSCDERVLKQMGGGIKSAYASSLLSLATGRRLINGSPLAFGEGDIKERVKNVLNYKKPAFWISILAVIACIIATICLLSNPKVEADTPYKNGYENPYAAQLFEHRTRFVGDNSAVSNIVSLLNFPSDVAYDHIELQTTSEPYGVAVYLNVSPEVRASYDTSEPENIEVFRVNACIMLSLIENANHIRFYLEDSTESAAELQFSRDWAESIVGADLWKESRSAASLDSLLTQISQHVKNAYTVATEMSTGPFVGYVKDADTDTFDVYTEEGGAYIMSLPWSLFEEFPATDRRYPGWQPGWMTVDIYCGVINDFTWAVVCTGPSLGTGNANVATSTDGGKTWWVGDRDAMYTGTVTGAGFASSNVGFMSYRYFFDQGPEISRTLDGGKTWDRMTVDIPDKLTAYDMTPLIPTFAGASGIYPIQLSDAEGNRSMAYLSTADGGMTWQWVMPDTLVAYVDENLSEAEARALQSTIDQIPNVEDAIFINRNDAWTSFEAKYEDKSVLENLDPSVLRHRYEIHMRDISQAEQTASDMSRITGIIKVTMITAPLSLTAS